MLELIIKSLKSENLTQEVINTRLNDIRIAQIGAYDSYSVEIKDQTITLIEQITAYLKRLTTKHLMGFKIVEKSTGFTIARYSPNEGLKARRKAHKMDSRFGAINYIVKPMYQGV